jgi:hypothetical protein
MPADLLSYLADNIVYVAGVIGALAVVLAFATKAINRAIDIAKYRHRAWHYFLIKELYDKSFQPYMILESKSLDCTLTNQAMRNLFSAGDQDFKGKAWFRLIEPLELSDVLKSWRDAFDNKSDYTRTVSVILPDGTKLKMQFTGEAYIYLNRTRAFIVSAKIVRGH